MSSGKGGNEVRERFLDPRINYVQPFEKHVAEAKWQFCNCQSCQEYRHLIESAPGVGKVDFKTFRHKDERY